MRNKLVFVFLLFLSIQSYSQITDLYQLAKGDLVEFSPIFDQDKRLYGYMSIYDQGLENNNERKFEYIVLDTRLVEVANGEFLMPTYKTCYGNFMFIEKVNNSILISRLYLPKNPERLHITFTSYLKIDLSTNTISNTFYLEDGKFIEGFRDPKTLVKSLRKYRNIDLLYGFEDQYLSFQIEKSSMRIGGALNLTMYNKANVKKWHLDLFSKEELKLKKFIHYEIELLDKDIIIVLKKNKYYKNLKFINPNTGKEIKEYLFENRNSTYNHDYQIEKQNQNIIISGQIKSNSLFGYSNKDIIGYFKIALDLQGNELSKKYFLWEDIAKGDFLDIDEEGRLEDKYKLRGIDIFLYNDGRIFLLAEKTKRTKTTDYMILEFDKEFKLINIHTIEKEESKTYFSHYLFSQKLKDRDGFLFFYQYPLEGDKRVNKKWVLGIVKLIDGKISYEEIPISSVDYFIQPYIAKEGYILLNEYNKEYKHNKIRLEQINY